MSKYYKLAWSGNIFQNIIEDFNSDVEKELKLKHGVVAGGEPVQGDFNGDGKQDLLFNFYGMNYDGKIAKRPADGQLVLLLGDGKDGFKDGSSLLPNHGRMESLFGKMAVGDFNGDGVDDVVLTNHNEDGRGNEGQDAFTAPQYGLFSDGGKLRLADLDFETWGRSSVSGDFNDDGLDDFLTFGWSADPNGTAVSMYLQNADGTLQQKWVNDYFGAVLEAGDFDGDGKSELANYVLEDDDNGVPTGMGMRVTELNPDGSLGESKTLITPVFRTEEGISWSGQPTTFAIMKDSNGKEFMDVGLHFSATGDVTGDGADDIVAIRYAHKLKYVDGKLTERAPQLDHLEIYSMTDNGMEQTGLKIRGWTPPKGVNVDNVDLVDWNGDGHLDIFVPWGNMGKDGVSEAARIFLNDGVGNFDRLDQDLIPTGIKGLVQVGQAIDANKDGIMDMLLRPQGFDETWLKWGNHSESLYLGTKRNFNAHSNHNPAEDGAAGFNEAYYLSQLGASGATLKSSGYESALDHYLSVGQKIGTFGFAVGTHVYGYSGSETITLREGNESVDAFGGDDTITGAAGADTLNGGKGADTFVYMGVTDSGVTSATRDIIEDLESGNDRIDLSGIDAIAGTVSNDAFSFLEADGAAFTGDAGELRWYSAESGESASRIIEGDVDGDSVADFQIELTGTGAIGVTDLVL